MERGYGLNSAENITIRPHQPETHEDAQSSGISLTYQNSLRVIGRYLDQCQTISYGITESDNGFIVNPLKRSKDAKADTIFSECVLQALLREAAMHRGRAASIPAPLRLFGTSSEDLLRAVGYKLDARRVRMAAVAVLPSRVVICGWQPASNRESGASEPFELILDLPAVRMLLFEARSRRGKQQPLRMESAMSETERRLAYRMGPLEIDSKSSNIFSN